MRLRQNEQYIKFKEDGTFLSVSEGKLSEGQISTGPIMRQARRDAGKMLREHQEQVNRKLYGRQLHRDCRECKRRIVESAKGKLAIVSGGSSMTKLVESIASKGPRCGAEGPLSRRYVRAVLEANRPWIATSAAASFREEYARETKPVRLSVSETPMASTLRKTKDADDVPLDSFRDDLQEVAPPSLPRFKARGLRGLRIRVRRSGVPRRGR